MKHIQLYEKFFSDSPIQEANPTAVYNADEQKLIAIFKSRSLAGKFLFGVSKTPIEAMKSLTYSLAKRTAMRPTTTRLGCMVAVRNASQEQKDMLGNNDYLLLDERYQEFTQDLPKLRPLDPPRTSLATPGSKNANNRIEDLTPDEIELIKFTDPDDFGEQIKKQKLREIGREAYNRRSGT